VGPDGLATVKAARVRDGAIGPLGGHKGFGLGLCVGLLSGPLVGALTGKALAGWFSEQPGAAGAKGHFFIVIDPAAFGDVDSFRTAVSAYIQEIKGSRKEAGVSEIRVPGERAFLQRERNLIEGIPVDEIVWEKTAALAADLGVQMPL
ncbi:MAG: Ldh family oxidoreductase, partial [Arenicellales bacterium]|nr:Ldh family oxidoreductase [Arenicellales bacterium]